MVYGNMSVDTVSRGMPGSVSKATANYLKECPKAAEKCKVIFETAEEMIKAYKKVLTPSDVSKARGLCWGRQTRQEYISMFRSSILMSYRVWEITPERFLRLYNTIKKENPEWAVSFMRDYEHKLRMCKAHVEKIAV